MLCISVAVDHDRPLTGALPRVCELRQGRATVSVGSKTEGKKRNPPKTGGDGGRRNLGQPKKPPTTLPCLAASNYRRRKLQMRADAATMATNELAISCTVVGITFTSRAQQFLTANGELFDETPPLFSQDLTSARLSDSRTSRRNAHQTGRQRTICRCLKTACTKPTTLRPSANEASVPNDTSLVRQRDLEGFA
ncbi:hypothetical protein IF1G_10799 [Cordyceps javanica]|uniref:Uncharacterized protein n=1 Tax=Cordyceps javanica TaxID=43265 RepID=A0A545ULY0_9HYPO|nr:hypothetical protein IF1G_10799 [Cordyceps javanica]